MSRRVEVLVVGLVPDTAPLPPDPREGAYDHVVRDDDPAGGVGVRGAVDIDEPATGGGQDAVGGDVGVLDRVDVDRRAVGVVGEGALARYGAAIVGEELSAVIERLSSPPYASTSCIPRMGKRAL